jgi:hypothetical protein
MLHHSAPIVEDSQFDGRLVGMLHDAGENINWREIKIDSPVPNQPNQEPPLVRDRDLPPPPAGIISSFFFIHVNFVSKCVLKMFHSNIAEDNPNWAFHDWVLDTKKWHAYYNQYGVPVQYDEVSWIVSI